DAGEGNAVANVSVNLASVDQKTLRVLATTSVAAGARATLGVGARQSDGVWRGAVPALGPDGALRLKDFWKDVGGRGAAGAPEAECATDGGARTRPTGRAHR